MSLGLLSFLSARFYRIFALPHRLLESWLSDKAVFGWRSESPRQRVGRLGRGTPRLPSQNALPLFPGMSGLDLPVTATRDRLV